MRGGYFFRDDTCDVRGGERRRKNVLEDVTRYEGAKERVFLGTFSMMTGEGRVMRRRSFQNVRR